MLAVLVATSVDLKAAVSLYPRELYGGMNAVSIKASSGVRRLQFNDGGRWRDLAKGQRLRNLRIISAPPAGNCAKSFTLYLFVEQVTRAARIELRIVECDGSQRQIPLETGPLWTVDHQEMGVATVGETICQTFRVASTDSYGTVIVDRVVAPSGSFSLRFPATRPPVRIGPGRTYHYQVCFDAKAPGRFKMPIHVYIRRNQPNGGFNSFIVADTAYVSVIGPPPPARVVPRTEPPVRRPVRRPPPRVRQEPTPPIVPVVPPPRAIPDVGRVAARAVARPAMPAESVELIEARAVGELVAQSDLTDPTTFRTIVLPTARPLEEGRSFVASYDVAGILAGYGVTDRLTVIGGGLFVPGFVGEHAVDLTAGARYEIYRGDFTRIAAGAQLNYSRTDSSAIALIAPFVVASVGDDDRRASIALSFSARRHDPVDGQAFSREAIVVAAGGDIRVGRHWKLAAEGYWIQRSSYQPVIATVRYFGERFAIDAGAAVDVWGDGAPVAPVVSLVWVFGR
jgi:hypothetical protein